MCFLFSLMFHHVGLSTSIGAFIAGVLLGNLPYNIEIVGRVKPLRDFFATMFFASLGMQLIFIFSTLVVFVLFVAIFKPFLFMFVSAMFGYRKHPVFMGGVALAQTSEFGLIIMAQGVALGVVGQDIFSLSILVAIATITITTYYLTYENRIYMVLKKALSFLDRYARQDGLDYLPEGEQPEIVMIGHNRVGYGIFRKLHATKKSFLVVDFNPEVIRDLIQQKIPCLYGDVGDLEILERLHLAKKKMIISTIYDEQTNKLLIRETRKVNAKALIFVTAYHVEEALALYNAGADYVILPHFLGGDHVSLILEDVEKDMTKIIQRKIEHIEELYNHHTRGHHSPFGAHHYQNQQQPNHPYHKG